MIVRQVWSADPLNSQALFKGHHLISFCNLCVNSFHYWHGKCPTDIQPRSLRYEGSVVWHCLTQHKFSLVNMSSHTLVSCRPSHKKSGVDKCGVLASHVMDLFQLNAVPQLPDGTIYQQVGAPPHVANIIRTFFYEQFPTGWIGRGSPYMTWSARSLYLTPPDFFSCAGLLETRFTGRQ